MLRSTSQPIALWVDDKAAQHGSSVEVVLETLADAPNKARAG